MRGERGADKEKRTKVEMEMGLDWDVQHEGDRTNVI
jgi:hypothetical protein